MIRLVVVVGLLWGTQTYAHAQEQCVPADYTCVPPAKCDCASEKGDRGPRGYRGKQGPKGDKGEKGEPGPVGVQGADGAIIILDEPDGVRLGVGCFGSLFVPVRDHAYSHGLSFRIESDDTVAELGLAPFKKGAVMAHVNKTRPLTENLSWGPGVFFQVIGLASGVDTGYSFALTGELVYRRDWLTVGGGPALGYSEIGESEGVALGIFTSAGVSLDW